MPLDWQIVDSFFDNNRQGIIDDLCGLAAIRSVSERDDLAESRFGVGCRDAVNYAVGVAERMGLDSRRAVDYSYGVAALNNGIRSIGIFSHLDVVPEGDGWTGEPYTPRIQGDSVIGRGVADNKAAAVLGLYVLRCIRELKIPLSVSIKLFMGTNEECGMEDIKSFLINEGTPDISLVADVSFPVCNGEKGLIQGEFSGSLSLKRMISAEGGAVSNVIPDMASCILRCTDAEWTDLRGMADKTMGAVTAVRLDGDLVQIKAFGKTGHCAFPEGCSNANFCLFDFLPTTGLFEGRELDFVQWVRHILGDFYGDGMGISYEDSVSGALTAVGCVLRCGDDSFTIDVNIRYPVTDSNDRIVAALEAAADEVGYKFSVIRSSGACHIDENNPLVTLLCDVYNDYRKTDAKPYIMGGGTYARMLPMAVGFGPGSLFYSNNMPAGTGGAHQPDEAQSISALLEACKIYLRAVVALDAAMARKLL